MKKMPEEFEGLCVGLDVALSHDRRTFVTQEESEQQFDSAVKAALSGCDKHALENIKNFLSEILTTKDAGKTLEELWMSLKPTRVFFAPKRKKPLEPPYVVIFRRVLTVIQELLDTPKQ